MAPTPDLDLQADPVELTAALCDIPSVSGQEAVLADAVHAALLRLAHLQVHRDGDAVVARSMLGRAERVVLAGHLDTVPVAGNLPTRRLGSGPAAELAGRGTVDMKGGVAAFLAVAATLSEPTRDVTYVFYDNEEVTSDRNGLGRLARTAPELLAGDFAVLGEPTNGQVEGGCNGTLRVRLTARGRAAHSARAWMGSNAVHALAGPLARLQAYAPAAVSVDGLVYREGLNAVGVGGGIAGNVIPDEAWLTVNYRFAPDKDVAAALAHVREVFPEVGAGQLELEVQDAADGARPGLDHPAARAFVQALGLEPAAKYGWTDVARFTALGIPAVNYGPGDPSLAHADDERCPVGQIRDCTRALVRWLS